MQLLIDFHGLENKKNRQECNDSYTLCQVSDYVLKNIEMCQENAHKFTHLRNRICEAIVLLNQVTKNSETYEEFRSMIVDELGLFNFKCDLQDFTVTMTDLERFWQPE